MAEENETVADDTTTENENTDAQGTTADNATDSTDATEGSENTGESTVSADELQKQIDRLQKQLDDLSTRDKPANFGCVVYRNSAQAFTGTAALSWNATRVFSECRRQGSWIMSIAERV